MNYSYQNQSKNVSKLIQGGNPFVNKQSGG